MVCVLYFLINIKLYYYAITQIKSFFYHVIAYWTISLKKDFLKCEFVC